MSSILRDPSPTPIQIVVDHREEASGLPAALRRHWPSVVESNARFGPSLETLMGIPGVGLLRAKRLLLSFGSIAGVARASAKALRQVGGIGPTTAVRILTVLHAAPAPSSPGPPAPPAAPPAAPSP